MAVAVDLNDLLLEIGAAVPAAPLVVAPADVMSELLVVVSVDPAATVVPREVVAARVVAPAVVMDAVGLSVAVLVTRSSVVNSSKSAVVDVVDAILQLSARE